MNKYLAFIVVTLAAILTCVLSSCGNSRAEEALEAYEKIADELVEARAHNDFQRQMEIAVELRAMQAEYADVKADRDLNDEQRERLAVVIKKITSGGYDEMLENMMSGNCKHDSTGAETDPTPTEEPANAVRPLAELSRRQKQVKSESSSMLEGKTYEGFGNAAGLGCDMLIKFESRGVCTCRSDWYRSYPSPITTTGNYIIKNNRVTVRCNGETLTFTISDNGKTLSFDNSDAAGMGSASNDFMTLHLKK